eukprot:NODE_6392_length_641_cov_48.570039_g6369_i0.p1 GENE.NODE_6392_length_641_cov_48.570039_g6369_i0~~NODE_6392_length_641_cov_48.570039_g6369_i0.p1  ORF type:complete len:183 (-),score=26.27 NODE_6392_length_641_cov_48.570039_g6369_i0:4-552(-)
MEATSFQWSDQLDAVYSTALDGRQLIFNGDPSGQYKNALGSAQASSGKVYWRVRAACDNMKIGIATAGASSTAEIGKDDTSWAINLQTGDVTHKGQVITRLWKLMVPISGGLIGLLLDVDEGRLSMFFNDEFQGVAVSDPDLKTKGPIVPCAGIGGLEGKFCTALNDPVKMPKLYTYKRNKI